MSQLQTENGGRPAFGTRKNTPYYRDANVAMDFTFSPAAGAANVCNVTITMLDRGIAPAAITTGQPFNLWLSDAATGIGLTAVTASGTVTPTTGTVFGTGTAKKMLQVQPDATGVVVLAITDTAKTGFYVCAQCPFTGQTIVSTVLTAANYG